MVNDNIKYKLQFAFFKMTACDKNQKRVLSSLEYEVANRHNKEASSVRQKLRKGTYTHSDVTKQKMSDAKKDKIQMYNPVTKHKVWADVSEVNTFELTGYIKGSGINMSGVNNPMFGKVQSNMTKQKIAKANSRCTLTEDGRRRKSEYMKQNFVNPMLNPKYKEKARLAKSKDYIVTSPTGEIFEIKNLAEFCRNHELPKSGMCSVAKGKARHYKKWLCKYK